MIETIIFYSLIAGIWWLYAFAYRDFMVDKTRVILFEIRDELFDRALEGDIGFDDKAYITTRNILNGLIRFTHNFSLLRFFILDQVKKNCDISTREEFAAEYKKALDNLSEEQRKICKITLIRAHLAITLHIFNTSPILSVIFWPIRFILFVFKKIRHIKYHYNNGLANSELFDLSKEFWEKLDARANFLTCRKIG